MKSIDRREVLVGGLFGTAAILGLDLALRPGAAAQAVGKPAPAFTLPASNGRTVSLADFKGKTVVLEWTNHDCPYVGKHYRGNNMQALQKKWTAKDVVWLSVISCCGNRRFGAYNRRSPIAIRMLWMTTG